MNSAERGAESEGCRDDLGELERDEGTVDQAKKIMA